MQASHTPPPAEGINAIPDQDRQAPLTLVSTAAQGLPERLAGRVDAHLATFTAAMRESLLASLPRPDRGGPGSDERAEGC